MINIANLNPHLTLLSEEGKKKNPYPTLSISNLLIDSCGL